MAPELGQAGFRIGMFITLVSGILLLVLERDSAEFVLMVGTFGLGVLFLALVGLLVKFTSRD